MMIIQWAALVLLIASFNPNTIQSNTADISTTENYSNGSMPGNSTISNSMLGNTTSSSALTTDSISKVQETSTPNSTTSQNSSNTVSSSTSSSLTTQSSSSTKSGQAASTSIESTSSSPQTSTANPPEYKFMISETNILLTDPVNYFIELQGKPNETVRNVWLVILNASMSLKQEPLLKANFSFTFNEHGRFVIPNKTLNIEKLQEIESVLLVVYSDEENADNLSVTDWDDLLLYSAHGDIFIDINNTFFSSNMKQKLIIDHKKLAGLKNISLSRCSEDGMANDAAVLTRESPWEANLCTFTVNQELEMKLTKADPSCTYELNPHFNRTLASRIVTDVNYNEHCGLALPMLKVIMLNKSCIDKRTEILMKFTVTSAFPDQLNLITAGYKNFVTKSPLELENEFFDISACEKSCVPHVDPIVQPAENNIRVTVAVVLSCIGIFLLVLLLVILYLRKKKKNILQFRMNRLDEDDDLGGDMDDFVGNQGPTFRNFK